MTSVAENVINDIVADAPTAPAAQIAEAAVSTIEAPTPSSIMADIQTVMAVYKEIEAKLVGIHPSVINVLKALL